MIGDYSDEGKIAIIVSKPLLLNNKNWGVGDKVKIISYDPWQASHVVENLKSKLITRISEIYLELEGVE